MARIKKKTPLASLIVTQANELVESRYNLTLGEQRLIFTMIARIQPDDEDFKPYRISLNELAEFLGIDKNHIYSDCKKITKKLLGKVVEIQETGRLLQTHWVSSADYIDGTGVVNLTFDPLLKPYLLQLKGNFTSSKLEMLLSFKSQYTMRMYTLLKQYERLNGREVELYLLREILGIGKEQYKLYTDFKRNILEPTQKELKAKADLTFEFDEIKYGRRVGAIRFKILSQKKLIEPTQDKDTVNVMPLTPRLSVPVAQKDLLLDKLLSLVPEQHKAKKTVQSALESFGNKQGFDYVKRNILYSNAKADKSYAGFLNSALKADWGHDWAIERKIEGEEKKQIVEAEQSKKDDDVRKRKESKEKHEKVLSGFYSLSQDVQDGIKNDFLESIQDNTFVVKEWAKTARANENPIE
ncbi:MAG: initiator RepB protein family protein, partial [Methylococcaceae bacterium NSP1-2]